MPKATGKSSVLTASAKRGIEKSISRLTTKLGKINSRLGYYNSLQHTPEGAANISLLRKQRIQTIAKLDGLKQMLIESK